VSKPIIEVAAGLLYHEGRYLIARRKPGVHLAGFWEFPGGKKEAGESIVECLHRELFEELHVKVGCPIPYQIVQHEYAEKIVELHFFRCVLEQGPPVPVDGQEIRWVSPKELTQFQFPPADQVVIDALRREESGVSL